MRLRLLVIEGNVAAARRAVVARFGEDFGTAYAGVLARLAPSAEIDIVRAADPDSRHPGDLGRYHGVAITGSALNIYDREPGALRQIDLVREIFAAGTPCFGSCWGLQVATVAAGGSVVRSPNGRELGVARKIKLSDEGRRHPLHAGRPVSFDALAIHLDEVATRPAGMVVTAANAHSPVQGAEIRHGPGLFWGVQFHPEFTLGHIGGLIAMSSDGFVQEGFARSADAMAAEGAAFEALEADPGRRDLAWRLGLDADTLDEANRLTEIRNWIEHAVKPNVRV